MYVTCQVDEDLPYILKVAGEDSLMVGSDYTHRDQSMEYEFPRLLKERAEQARCRKARCRRSSTTTPRRFMDCEKNWKDLADRA